MTLVWIWLEKFAYRRLFYLNHPHLILPFVFNKLPWTTLAASLMSLALDDELNSQKRWILSKLQVAPFILSSVKWVKAQTQRLTQNLKCVVCKSSHKINLNVSISGHLFGQFMKEALDIIKAAGGSFHLVKCQVGQGTDSTSYSELEMCCLQE
ncbi:alpha-aminoadipic semialdehyde synthase [Artemisia annua]|uniref:Alpha-aminoadipic semialdehyde synthase n=1 Tax=Artemisia annua TaxID=35608 RepID=A0A2U1PYP9_ARTAN|nr:alpha-aminoadipic semialdehyde synthase [Artemisia annua]